MLQQHSGGKPSEALRMALRNEDASLLIVKTAADGTPRRNKYTRERIVAMPEALEVPPPKARKTVFSFCCPGQE